MANKSFEKSGVFHQLIDLDGKIINQKWYDGKCVQVHSHLDCHHYLDSKARRWIQFCVGNNELFWNTRAPPISFAKVVRSLFVRKTLLFVFLVVRFFYRFLLRKSTILKVSRAKREKKTEATKCTHIFINNWIMKSRLLGNETAGTHWWWWCTVYTVIEVTEQKVLKTIVRQQVKLIESATMCSVCDGEDLLRPLITRSRVFIMKIY